MKKHYRYILKNVGNIVKKHRKEVINAAYSTALALGIIGVGTGTHASLTQKSALTIRREAESMLNESREQAEEILKSLGKLELSIIESFEEFAQLIERIQERPRGLADEVIMEELYSFTINDLKILTAAMDLTLSAAGGATPSLLLGIAVFGIEPLTMATGIVFSSFAVCAKGIRVCF